MRAVVVTANDGLDDVATDDTDVGAVSNVDVTIRGDGQTCWGEGKDGEMLKVRVS